MYTRPPESLIWGSLVVLLSMDVISPEMINDLGFRTENFEALKAELRNTITESKSNSTADISYSLWSQALSKVEASLGWQVRCDFEKWGVKFPCDSDAALKELDAWERTWPDLGNVLRWSQSALPWGEDVASGYHSAVRNRIFDQKLQERLAGTVSEWDDTCFRRYANENRTFKADFFTTLSMGAERLRLCRFWKKESLSLSAEQKAVVWQLGLEVWNRMHYSKVTDLKIVRSEYDKGAEKAAAALNFGNQRYALLPSPDILLSYV